MIKTTKITGIIASIIIMCSSVGFYFLNENVLSLIALITGLIGGLSFLIASILADLTYKPVLIGTLIAAGIILVSSVFLLIGVQTNARYPLVPLMVISIVLTSISTLLKLLICKTYR